MPDVSRVPAPDPADTLDFFIAAPISEHDAVATQKARAALDALLAGRRQDKERIERLERALEPFVEYFRESYPEAFADLAHLPDPWSIPVIVTAAQIRDAAAALAGEEDTPNG